MKAKYLILFLLFLVALLIALNAKAQTAIYHSFPDSNAVWNEESAVNIGENVWNHWQERYFINGDTSITKTYHKLYVKRLDEEVIHLRQCMYSIPGSPQLNYIGAIRQDTAEKKVYFLPADSINATLLYDFNLHVGDTLPPSYSYYNDSTIKTVTTVDSIFIGTNYRKFFLFSPYYGLIEGIGSTWGLFGNNDPPYYVESSLHCFQQNGITIYTDSCLIGCDMATAVNSILDKNTSIEISPNPATTHLTIQLPSAQKGNLSLLITNLLGQTIYQSAIRNKQSEIDISNLSPALYFLEVIGEKERWGGKFVKE